MNTTIGKLQNSNAYKWLLLTIIMLGTFMAVLDSTIVNVGMPTIMTAFNINLSAAEWILTAYMLTMTIMLPTTGWLADKYGNKKVYLIGLAIFTIGSWLCGQSQSDEFLVMSRAIQGIGGGTIQALGLAIITREFPVNQRGIALGIWSVASAASVSFGPMIGGYIIDHYHWTLMFDLNVPIGIISAIAGIILLKEWKQENMGKFDFVGFITASLFMTLTIFGLARGNSANNPQGWASSWVIGAMIVAVLSGVLFIRNELRHSNPLLDIRLFSDRNFRTGMLVLVIFGIGLFGGTYLLPLYMQQGLGYTAMAAGAVFLPVGIIQGIASTVTGWIEKFTGSLTLIISGIVILAVSFWMAGHFTADTTHTDIILTLCIRGLGMGLVFAPLNVFSLQNILEKDLAAASGISNSLRQLSGSISIALLTAIMTFQMNSYKTANPQETETDSLIYGITHDFRITFGMMFVSLIPIVWYVIRSKKEKT